MDFSIPTHTQEAREQFRDFIASRLLPHLSGWTGRGEVPRSFFRELGEAGWLGFHRTGEGIGERSVLEQAVLTEELAKVSPGVCVAVLVQVSLGLKAVLLFGSDPQKSRLRDPAVRGETLLCLGNTESGAGSDVAGIQTRARKVKGGWVLDGVKAFVTNGALADWAAVTAVSDPQASANRRISMYLVDLSSSGVTRTKLDKRVWIPSDLTRIEMREVFVPEDALLGEPGHGLQQVLEIFTQSRVLVAALTLGTGVGAFDLALERATSRKVFGRRLVEFEAKAFEIADGYARLEAARLALWRACWAMDQGGDGRLEASLAKYLTVEVARDVCAWAADLFGAASVVAAHPIHKYPMDAWASSLGEGTQDVQKLVIFREMMKERGHAVR